MPTEEEQIQARREALAEAKRAQIAKGRQKRERTGPSPLQRRQQAKRDLTKAKAASTEALRKLEEAVSVSLDKDTADTSNQRRRLDERLRIAQGLAQNTDSNNE